MTIELIIRVRRTIERYIHDIRAGFAATTLLCLGALVTVGVMEWLGLEPCPLCWFQRIAVLWIAAASALGWWLAPRAYKTILGVAFVGVVAGVGLALRHLWLQSLSPEEVPSCLPNMDWLLSTMSLWDASWAILTADGDCAKEAFSLLGLTIPGMMLVLCVLCAALLGWQALVLHRASKVFDNQR